MNKQGHPKDVVLRLLKRSRCRVQVAAVLSDSAGVHAWGWNHEGAGFGEHAEIACLKRANHKRVAKSVMWVAARRKKSGNIATAKPCAACWPTVSQCCYIVFRRKDGEWETCKLSC